MTVPYRTRKFFKRLAGVLLAILAAGGVLWLIWLLWLGRFVVYSREQGAVLDFNLPAMDGGGVAATPPEPGQTVPIHYQEQTEPQAPDNSLKPLVGYYVDREALAAGFDNVRQQLEALPEGTPVMVDVKSIYGEFFYSSRVSQTRPEDWDAAAMDSLIAFLHERGLYAIARFPALRDYDYGLNHVADGLPTPEGYLWMDEARCYWLDPGSEGTLAYLSHILRELREGGFDEAVLSDFCYPDTQEAVIPEDREKALSDAAKTLVAACTTDRFAVSFVGQDAAFPLPEGRSRLYLENVSAADVTTVATQTGLADPAVRLVFLTQVNDTRFEAYSVLRPLENAH